MRQQFVYTEKIVIPPKKEGEKASIEERKNSFNIGLVIRAVTMDDGRLLILINDLHERWQDIPSVSRNGKKIIKREKDTFQSEIFLTKQDGKEFLELTRINNISKDEKNK